MNASEHVKEEEEAQQAEERERTYNDQLYFQSVSLSLFLSFFLV